MKDELKGIQEVLDSWVTFLNKHYEDIIEDENDNFQIYIKKALAGKISDFRIVVYPNDHMPAHFHAISKQRNINARLDLYTLEPLPGEIISPKDLKKIQYMMRFPKSIHEKVLELYKQFS